MTARKPPIESLPDWPRRLSREQAAAYVGISPSYFDDRVSKGLLPNALDGYGKRQLWDRKQLDARLDAEIGLSEGSGFDPIAEAAYAYQDHGR